MDLQQVMVWLVAGNTVIAFGTAAYNLLSTRGTKALAAVDKIAVSLGQESSNRRLAEDAINARFALVESRVQKLETEFAHLPDQQAVHQLQLTMKDMQVEITKIAAAAERSARTSDRVEQYLMERAK
jgi:hypothetical protein